MVVWLALCVCVFVGVVFFPYFSIYVVIHMLFIHYVAMSLFYLFICQFLALIPYVVLKRLSCMIHSSSVLSVFLCPFLYVLFRFDPCIYVFFTGSLV